MKNTLKSFDNADNQGRQNPLVSIIIPIYMVENYLERCIESILGQTYCNYEMLLVDDGSPDNCGVICDEYAKKYGNIRVLHQKNQGVSAARNNAIMVAQGDYITFIDPDDFVTEDYIQYLMSLIQKYNAEIAIGNHIYQYESTEPKSPKPESQSCFYKTEEALIKMNYIDGFGSVVWGKMYRAELVASNLFPIGKRYEDVATTYRIIGDSTGVAYGNKQIYYWVQRSSSFMHKSFSKSQFDGMEATENQISYIRAKFPAALPAAKYRHTAKAVELASILFSCDGDRESFKKLQSYADEYADEVLKDVNVKESMRIRIRALKMGYLPSKLVYHIHKILKSYRLK